MRKASRMTHSFVHLPIVFLLAMTSLPLFNRVTLPMSLSLPLLAIGGIMSYGRQ